MNYRASKRGLGGQGGGKGDLKKTSSTMNRKVHKP